MVDIALSIRQPWVDLILSGRKTIEVREWSVVRRGPFLIHASTNIDWRAAELFGYEDVLALPRGGVVGYAEIVNVINLTPGEWHARLEQHCVVHQRRLPQYGALLNNIRDFGQVIRCGGRQRFFPVPPDVTLKVGTILKQLGILGTDDPSTGGSTMTAADPHGPPNQEAG